MALPIGLTSAGLQIPTVEETINEIRDNLWTAFGTTLEFSSALPLYQFTAVFANALVLVCELIQAAYNAYDPDAATGDALESLSKLTGTLKDPARSSTVTLTLTGTPTTVVASGSRAANAVPVEFATTADATIAAATAWAALTIYTDGQIRTNASRVYIVITPGTSAGSGGPTTQAADITDGTVHWKYLGEGTGYVDAAAASVETGPFESLADTITTIITPVAGWSSVRNLLDADPGANVETDESLRARREDEIANAGVSPQDALRAHLLEIDDVEAVTVFMNLTDTPNGDGMPPHSVECLVQGGNTQEILEALHTGIAAGIQSYGTTSGTVVDSSGDDQTYSFTRPDEIEIYVDVFVTVDADEYPSDGDTQIEAAIVAWGDALPIGYNARGSAIAAQCFKVAGVLEVTLVELGDSPSPGSTLSVSIGTRERATFDSSRITVTSVAGTP